ncbi:hypothetical protein QE152_g36194 [Popillia japonica]|uniref:Transposase n=1 Tax=Popillia japonica TaxID=7064 RepID=A0AAW1IDT7_POPJA
MKDNDPKHTRKTMAWFRQNKVGAQCVTADNNLDTWEELTEVEIADNVLANNIEQNMEEEEDPEIDNTDTEFEPATILQAIIQAVETLSRFATFGNSDLNDLWAMCYPSKNV